MTSLHRLWLVAAVTLAAPLVRLAAQRPAATQRQVDSLAAQLRTLQIRFDSVLAVLARLQATGGGPARADSGLAAARADSAAVQDDLAALRAAASVAAGAPDTMEAAEQQPTQFVGRERSQTQLNPEITVTGDIRAYATTSGIQRDNFDPREFEIGFQSALDPYSRTKIFVSLENGEVGIEEGYAYWIGLPGHLRLDVGKFRQQFGELNRWHLHAVPETEYPLALTTYLGEDGLAGTGVSLYRAFGGFGTHELTAQVTRSSSDGELFAGGRRPSYLLHLRNFWQLGRATYMQLGGTGLLGGNPDSSLHTAIGGVEFRFTWRPPEQALYRDLTLRSELLVLRKRYGGAGATRLGGYVSSAYRLTQRFVAGVRYDYVEDPTVGIVTRQIVPSLTLWQSEWVFLRAQYQWQKIATASPTHQIALQAVWAMGPHKHETY